MSASPDSSVRVVLVAFPGGEAARAMARTLVEEELVACGSIVPGVTSVYRWEGAVVEDAEALLILKTDASRIPDLLRRIPELHTYDLPEILALPVAEGHQPYLDWVRASLSE